MTLFTWFFTSLLGIGFIGVWVARHHAVLPNGDLLYYSILAYLGLVVGMSSVLMCFFAVVMPDLPENPTWLQRARHAIWNFL